MVRPRVFYSAINLPGRNSSGNIDRNTALVIAGIGGSGNTYALVDKNKWRGVNRLQPLENTKAFMRRPGLAQYLAAAEASYTDVCVANGLSTSNESLRPSTEQRDGTRQGA